MPLAKFRGGLGQQLATSALTRILLLPLSAATSLVNARMTIGALGLDGYGIVGLIVTLPQVLPITDLGLGAAVTNTAAVVAEHGPDPLDREWARAYRLLWRISLTMTLVLAVFVLVSVATESTQQLNSIPVAGAVALIPYVLGMPFGLGHKVLGGLGRVGQSNVIAGTGSIVSLANCYAVYRLCPSTITFAAVPMISLLSSSIVAHFAARGAVRRLPTPASAPIVGLKRETLSSTAVPMLVISLMVPIALQSDRTILAMRSTELELGRYGVLASLAFPCLSIIQSISTTLWAHFAGNRTSITWRAFARLLAPTIAAGMVSAVLLLLVGPSLAEWLSDGREFDIAELAPFAILLILMGAHAPSGAFLSDARGLRFQASGTTVMACLSVGLTWWLSPSLGASGPVTASVVAVSAAMFLPCLIRVHRLTSGAGT